MIEKVERWDEQKMNAQRKEEVEDYLKQTFDAINNYKLPTLEEQAENRKRGKE